MTLEICIASVDGAELAKRFGATRVELCSGLSVGGLTPSIGLTAKCSKIIQTHAMLRPREGNFVYSYSEIGAMIDDINHLADTGAKGLVFGCLTTDNIIDIESCAGLIAKTKRLGFAATFHRAFDFTPVPKDSLETLIDLGFDRVLTSGQMPTAIDGMRMIKDLVNQANGRIEIMAGSGVNAGNALSLAEAGADALHFTSHRLAHKEERLGMGATFIADEEKINSITRLFP